MQCTRYIVAFLIVFLSFSIFLFLNEHAASQSPITFAADPVFGYQTKGGSAQALSYSGVAKIWSCKFSLSEYGIVQSITVYLYSTDTVSRNVKCAIYTDDGSPAAFVAETEDVSVEASFDGWQTFPFAIPVRLMTPSYYWLTVWAEEASDGTGIYIYTNTGASNQAAYLIEAYDSWPNPMTGETLSNSVVSIYASYLQPSWNDAEQWTLMVNGYGEWQDAESWTLIVSQTKKWYNVESWTLRTTWNASFNDVELWSINVYANVSAWYTVENWTFMQVNGTGGWHDVEVWSNISVTGYGLGLHDVETWTFNVEALKSTFAWDPAIQFLLPAYGTYIGFDSTAYFDNFTWSVDNTTITFQELYMDLGSPFPSLSMSMIGGNVSFSELDYLTRVTFRFYSVQGSIVSLYLTGLDVPPYNVTVDGEPIAMGNMWNWDGQNFLISYLMNSTSSGVVLSWAPITELWTDAESWDIALNPSGPTIVGLDLYFLSDTVTVNTVTGYSMGTTLGSTATYVSHNLGVSSASVQFGYTASLVNSRGVASSLTGDTPVAVVTVSGDDEGFQSSNTAIGDFPMNLGLHSLTVNLYVRLEGSSWILSAQFTTARLMYKGLTASSWQFTIYANTSLNDVGERIAEAHWGNNLYYVSGIAGLSFISPTPQELALYYVGQGDWVHAVMYPYMIYAGDLVYGIGILFVGGILYLRNKKWEVILVALLLFGGSAGIGLLIPDAAYRLLYIVVAFVITIVLYRVFK